MSTRPENYVPAAGHDFLLPLYDPLWRLLFREDRMRPAILEQARVGPGCRVLDVGCGTGTQAVLTKRTHPDAEVSGIDGDAKVLAIARRKAEQAGVEVAIEEGLATALPYADARFDRVVSSFVFHHLADDDKRRAMAEIRRVLAPGGVFVLVDFGPPRSFFERLAARLFRHVEHASANFAGGLPALLRESGFERVVEEPLLSMRFAHAWVWRATLA